MAVSQDRIIDLINAGLDFKQALDDMIALIDQAHERDPDHPGLASLWALSDYGKRLKQPYKSPFILQKEREHFRANRRRNIRNAAAAERKRRAQGAIPMIRERQFDPLEPAPRLTPRVPEGPDYSHISEDRKRQIEAEAEASARKWHPELFIDQPPTKPGLDDIAKQMGETYDPDDPENAFAEGQGITPAEAGIDEFISTPATPDDPPAD